MSGSIWLEDNEEKLYCPKCEEIPGRMTDDGLCGNKRVSEFLPGVKKYVTCRTVLTNGNTPKVHKLKTWCEYFRKLTNDEKGFEVRKNDRNFQVGDLLDLQQWCPETEMYTGVGTMRAVIQVWKDLPGMKDGYVLLIISKTFIDSGKKFVLYSLSRESHHVGEVER